MILTYHPSIHSRLSKSTCPYQSSSYSRGGDDDEPYTDRSFKTKVSHCSDQNGLEMLPARDDEEQAHREQSTHGKRAKGLGYSIDC